MEKRRHDRYLVREIEGLYPRRESNRLRIMNISRSGCAVQCDEALPDQGGKVVVDLPLPSKTYGLRIEARVVWVGRQDATDGPCPLVYGLRFEEMDASCAELLDAYLEFLRQDVYIAQLQDAWERLNVAQDGIEVVLAMEEKKGISYVH